jgi:hypothetical protein
MLGSHQLLGQDGSRQRVRWCVMAAGGSLRSLGLQWRVWMFGVCVMFASGTPAVASAGGVVGPIESAVTRKYLEAWTTYEKAAAANISASGVAVDAAVGEAESKCPEALANVPSAVRSPAQTRQLLDLKEELTVTVLAAWTLPDRQALANLVTSVMRARWPNRRVTAFAQENVSHYAASFRGSIALLCTDMDTWVESDYMRLGSNTEELAQRREAHLAMLGRPSYQEGGRLLARYEQASGQTLIRRLGALTEALNSKTRPLALAKQRIEEATDISTAATAGR